ncbi:RusA family crossover junction endodeoxyribonuclease [Clostridium sp. SYSU_GA19001]|uniref:RusA family crossover junction endodeoxyribonuclease n=1 Tax=Clostridium caldaquaticum TaxID=2940653 RepID=UPI0020775FCB|nr:RusA family crossover junction endodeoxyribonuclease [Clostridium caldaquaticum]MCM8709767.1 RusA family crossover junction endodeoxyribonuclease [Clostridium caldaquaticum]
MNNYAKIIVKGSPISKSNFKLFNLKGRAILPYNSGKYHDRYALYEEEIAYEARAQNPHVVISESVIAVLKVYYKSRKRHPDTNNITKSIFDGIEKSGLIVNDAQVRKLIIEEFYDSENPRFELELFGESSYCIEYSITKREKPNTPLEYSPPSNKKVNLIKKDKNISNEISTLLCGICSKTINKNSCISANNGKTLICKDCFKKLF